ncbi:MAG: hypothetical protein ACI4HI_06090 [Lachnospiraceae bacterium]
MEKEMDLQSVPMAQTVQIEEKTQEQKRVHHVGSITFGLTLILCGIIYLVHVFIPAVEVLQVIRFWPCILILLGMEVLAANAQEKVEFVYDKTAIFLTALVILFAIGMAGVDFIWQYANKQMYINF